MSSILVGQDFWDVFRTGVGKSLERGLELLFGPAVNNTAFGSVTWAQVASAVCVLLALLAVHAVATAWLNRKAEQSGQPVMRHAIRDTIKQPLLLLIWINGIYLCALMLLPKSSGSEGVNNFLVIWGKLFEAGTFAALFWLFLRFTHLLETRLAAIAARSESKLDDILVPVLGKTLRIAAPLVAIILALPLIGLPAEYNAVIGRISSLLIIGTVAWVLMQGVGAVEKLVLSRYDITAADNLQARKIHTQVHVISKTAYVLIGIFTIASALMLFEEVRRFGTSILASAGVLGIIVGFAAQRTIANLFAGFQLAMTQPIRLDDVVIVESEWGRVEEITLTYVIIHIWDDRRLVVPLSHFIEKPFQNWTRVSAQLLGSVVLWTDYTLPVEELRRVTGKIVEECKLWDRRFWNLQVTDANERAMQIRVLATAADSGKAWDLRCEIREKLLSHIQQTHPQCLQRFRASLEPDPTTTAPASVESVSEKT